MDCCGAGGDRVGVGVGLSFFQRGLKTRAYILKVGDEHEDPYVPKRKSAVLFGYLAMRDRKSSSGSSSSEQGLGTVL